LVTDEADADAEAPVVEVELDVPDAVSLAVESRPVVHAPVPPSASEPALELSFAGPEVEADGSMEVPMPSSSSSATQRSPRHERPSKH
jgi:hypothetical protein